MKSLKLRILVLALALTSIPAQAFYNRYVHIPQAPQTKAPAAPELSSEDHIRILQLQRDISNINTELSQIRDFYQGRQKAQEDLNKQLEETLQSAQKKVDEKKWKLNRLTLLFDAAPQETPEKK